ncbi:MAG: amino acid adenylation domain-containing protein [Vicinamibacterales bacterium]
MKSPYGLADLLGESATRFPGKAGVAVAEGTRITYAELDTLSDRLRDRLWHLGVRPGDRVGLRLHKSLDAVIAIFGILKAGAAYVPVDAESPAARGAFILNDCQVKALVTARQLEDALAVELQTLGASPAVLAIDSSDPGVALRTLLDSLQEADPAPVVPTVPSNEDDIAYILYTSGSTGNPKGVVLSHRNAASFVDWCSETFQPRADDVFSSHAPFHFDLSILDLYVAIKHGCTLVLFGEAIGKEPVRLASAIAAERITIWYSTPSILNFLALYGKLDRYDYSALRMVFFAGEVFPVPQFRAVKRLWSRPRYFNLYGPTETNVCTYYEVPDDGSWERMDTFPIGTICQPNAGMVVDERDERVRTGEPGELLISGPNVMQGYWNLPEQNRCAFFVDREGVRWYRTGDIVTEGPGGEYRYLNRHDRMVKRRGYRVELGEIEAGLLRHPDIREAAVVAVPDKDSGVRIAAFVSCQVDKSLTIIALKTLSSKSLPPYMIPDSFTVVDRLPRTSTNKVDFQALKSRA